MHAPQDPRGALCHVRWLGGLAAGLLFLSAAAALSFASDPPDALPCVPVWAVPYAAPVVAGGPIVDTGTGGNALRTQYDALVEFPVTSEVFCSGPDDSPTLSYFYTGNYPGNTVTQHVVDTGLQHTEGPLPITYGQSWLAVDLDLDGNTELILQRGDGSNGFLDILSAPGWTLRAHIVLAGMNVYFYPVAINVDADPYLELYLTPSSLGGSARAMLIDYNPGTGAFSVSSNLSAPNSTGGATAAGDFDDDGRVEFITGSPSGYYLFECVGGALVNRGTVGQSYSGNWATVLRPMPGGQLYALLGHSSFTNGYRYQLLRPTGDNTFEVTQVFQAITGYAGIHPSFGLDADVDGMDEFVMSFYPMARIYEWDAGLGSFQNIWSWDQTQTGTMLQWGRSDVDRDGVPEWCCVNHNNLFRAYEDQDVSPGGVADPIADRARASLLASPNPFVTGTRLLLRAPEAGCSLPVDLFDAGGRVVRRWTLAAGAPLDWDGRDAHGIALPAGAYYLRSAQTGAIASRLIRLR